MFTPEVKNATKHLFEKSSKRLVYLLIAVYFIQLLMNIKF